MDTTTDANAKVLQSEIDAVKAVEIAQGQLPTLVPKFAELEPFVEEVERSQDGKNWEITFRANNPDPGSESPYGGSIYLPFVDKLVRIGVRSGDLIGITNPTYR